MPGAQIDRAPARHPDRRGPERAAAALPAPTAAPARGQRLLRLLRSTWTPAPSDIERWYVERFLRLRDTRVHRPGLVLPPLRRAEPTTEAWTRRQRSGASINEPNLLREHRCRPAAGPRSCCARARTTRVTTGPASQARPSTPNGVVDPLSGRRTARAVACVISGRGGDRRCRRPHHPTRCPGADEPVRHRELAEHGATARPGGARGCDGQAVLRVAVRRPAPIYLHRSSPSAATSPLIAHRRRGSQHATRGATSQNDARPPARPATHVQDAQQAPRHESARKIGTADGAYRARPQRYSARRRARRRRAGRRSPGPASASAASTITRTSGSVPDGRSSTRPVSPSSASASATAAATARRVGRPGPVSTPVR